MSYYPPFSLHDDEGNEYAFDTELDTSQVPTFSLIVRIARNGEPFATRVWPRMVPMMGIVRSFAATFVKSSRMQERFHNDREASPEEAEEPDGT
jgi:hypothetical protein